MVSSHNNVVSVDWLKVNIDNPNLVILDASINKIGANSSAGISMGLGIPGALFFDLKKKFSDQSSDLPNTVPSEETFTKECGVLGINKNSQIIIYDRVGVYSSPRAWWLFQAMGHSQVSILDGGLPEWIRAGGKLIEPSNQMVKIPGNFIAKIKSDWIVNSEKVLGNISSKECLVLDARSVGRFNGTEAEPRAGLLGGHIPGSLSLAYSQVLDDGKFKSVEELKEIFNPLNRSQKKIIYSCGSGLTACIIFLAATIAGHSTGAIYDGSWTEWGNGKFPVEQ